MIRAACLSLVIAAAATAEGIIVEHAWSRATVAGQQVGAVFCLLRNPLPTEDRLVSATSDAAATVEVHEHAAGADGVMQMRRAADGVAIPANGSVELKPRSYHIMLIGLKKPLARGESVALNLIFAKAAPVAIQARINPPWAMAFDEGE